MKKTLLIAISVIGVAGVASVQAQLIDVDFNGNSVGTAYGGGGVAVGPTQSGAALIGSAGDQWNGISDATMGLSSGAGPIASGPIALNYANGSASGVSMVVNAAGSYDANEPTWSNYSPFTAAASPYSNLMEDEIFTAAASTITLSGLAANQAFSLVVYTAGDQHVDTNPSQGDTQKVSTFTVNGVTQHTTLFGTENTLVNGSTYLVFSAMSDNTGSLVINWGGTTAVPGLTNPETDLNGFQLQAVPEPSSLAIFGVAGMMLFVWRRRLVCS